MGPKAKSVLIKLASTAGTGFYYTTRRNPTKSKWVSFNCELANQVLITDIYKIIREMATNLIIALINSMAKLSLRKYDPIVREHVLFVESKLPSGKKR